MLEVLRQGEKDGLMPPRIPLEQIPAQCEGTIAENPFLAPTKKFPASISVEDQKRLADGIAQVVNSEVLPAYSHFADFIAKDYGECSRGRPQLKILELRHRAEQQLGPRFDIKAFHVETLGGGSLPLDMLEARIENWIRSQLRNGASKTKVLDSREP